MQAATKKFLRWMIIADIILIVIVFSLGFVFIKTNIYYRFSLIGGGMGQFLVFSNLAAYGIYYLIKKRKSEKK